MIEMDKISTLSIIEAMWEGPYHLKEIKNFKGDSDYGLYQIYGTHNIYGPDTLLYIGKSQKRTCSERFSEHKEWAEYEATSVDIYLGRLGGVDSTPSDRNWEDQIDQAERLLIYYCTPPYNSQGLNKLGKIPTTIVLNYGKRKKLPHEFSNIDELSSYWKNESNWKLYGT